MNKQTIVKKVAKIVVGVSTSFTVANVIANNVNPQNKLQQAEVIVGGIVAGAMVAQMAENYTDQQIDQLFNIWNDRSIEA